MGGSSHSGSHDKSTMVDTVDTAPEEAVLVDQDGRTAWLAGKLGKGQAVPPTLSKLPSKSSPSRDHASIYKSTRVSRGEVRVGMYS